VALKAFFSIGDMLEGAWGSVWLAQMVPEIQPEVDVELRRNEALLSMTDVLVRHQSLPELFLELAERLHQVLAFEVAGVALHDPAKNSFNLHAWEGGDVVEACAELPLADTTAGWVWQSQQPLLFGDIRPESRFSLCLSILKEKNIVSFCELPLSTTQRRLGTLGLGSSRAAAYSQQDLHFLEQVARLVTLALENAFSRGALEEEKNRLQMLLEVNSALVPNLNLQDSFPAIAKYIGKVIKHDFASIGLYDEAAQCMRKYATYSGEILGPFADQEEYSVRETFSGQAFLTHEVKIGNREDIASQAYPIYRYFLQHGIQTICCLPLITRKGALGTLNLASKEENAISPRDISLLKQIAAQIAVAIDNASAYREIAGLKEKLSEEKLYLQGEIRSELNFEEIIGESPVLKRLLEQAKTVAPSDATVLILGETGTGKELIARAVHRMSARKDASFIKLNCAAIPTGLLESELFGHEKGAFTGAISQKVGRLELADKGTLFLDEVGDIPLELQPKLLRVLQDQEFERLGSTRTRRVNIRLVAATNRDLAEGVASKTFRSDLYYRLNVFPVRLPPLRDRKDDIPLLVRYFVQKFARRMNKQIETIPIKAMNELVEWDWPGNVRELENFIERSVILSTGPALTVPLAELSASPRTTSHPGTLESLEREHILRALRESGGTISGLHGAAARLGLKRTTLQSRMQRMGISRQEYEN